MSIGDDHQPNSKALYTRYKDARVLGRSWNDPTAHMWEVDYVFVDHPTFLERVYGQTGSKLYGLLVDTIWEKLPVTQMGAPCFDWKRPSCGNHCSGCLVCEA